MKKNKHIALYIIGSIIIIIFALVIWQRKMIVALYNAITIDTEELSERTNNNEVEIKANLDKQGIIIPEITQDEVDAVFSGVKTTREAAEDLLTNHTEINSKPENTNCNSRAVEQETSTPSPAPSSSPTQTDVPTTPQPTVTTDPSITSTPDPGDYYDESETSETANYDINLRVTELYIIEALYFNKIDAVIQEAKLEYNQLPKDQKTSSNKLKVALSKASALLALQKECDTQVYAIIDEVKQILLNEGQSTSLSDNLKQYYEHKKADQQVYYMSKLKA